MTLNPRDFQPEFIALRDGIRTFLDLRTMKGLEVGPFDRPFFSKHEADVSFLDYRSVADLKLLADQVPGHSPEFVVELDYVVPASGDWSMVPRDHFDWILSSHTLEHTPNLMVFLNTMASKLKVGGLLISVLPDKRHTFDVYRPLTTLGTIVQDFLSSATMPRVQSVFDQVFYASSVSLEEAKNYSLLHKDTFRNNGNFEAALQEAMRSMGAYVDVHNCVFTSESFQGIVEQLCISKFVSLTPFGHLPTREDHLSFVSILKKTSATDGLALGELQYDAAERR